MAFPPIHLARHALLALLLGALSAHPAAQPTLRVALGETKLPYVDAEQGKGVEYDIVTQALSLAGYQPQVRFAPNLRAHNWLASGQVDAAIANGGGHVSDPYIVYQNMAITLCRRHIHLRRLDDLTRLRVAAFQGAHLYLGADFAALAPQIPSYREESPQATLNRLLLSGRADVAISDVNIFQQLSNELRHELDISPTLCPYALFTPTHYRLAFRNAQDRDRFNRGLRRFAADGGYEKLAERYQLPTRRGRPWFKP
ncbi:MULTISPECIES: ABC transporter substrate-binding protein [Chromobacterium]|uniref:Substrate-binding periplasmic protein n=1 Tax=Chromobacterium aquaticum TaxID=467180 RepID=A0ABV8ZQB0_9NEIS|nr:transporter substrate-binding domain-containing protein [Chromobacterium aquaticum]MCD5361987.1 transporter substrate-binding domain-containing protein [Chromobacterium aquaticum]